MSLALVELCRDCDDDLEHCHGTVFRHEDGSFECLADPDCYAPPEAHFSSLTCAEADFCGETGLRSNS
jgi:hypothetical protein